MGQKFKDEAGNIWEMDAGGQPRLVSPAAGGPQVVMPAVQDPLAPYKLQQERGQAAAAPFAAPKAQADATIAQANAGTAGTVAQAEAAKAQADARKAEFELRKLQTEQAKVDPKSGAYKALQIQIDRVSELYRNNLQGILPNSINDIIPDMLQPGAGAFDSAAQGLVNPFLSAFRVEGQGSQSDTELRQFLAANTPQQGDSDAVIEEKLRTIQTRLDTQIGTPAQTDKSAPLVASGQQPDTKSFSTDGYRDEVDPVLKGVAGRLGKMVAAGASDSVVMEFLKKNGVDPANTNIQGVLQHRRTPEYKTWQRANPGKPYPIGPDFYTNKVPLTPSQDLSNKVGQSGFGAFMINAGQGASGNRLDNLAGLMGGDPEAVNTGVQLSRANSPGASFAGDLTGQIMAQGAMNRIPGLSRLPGSSTGRMADDALYGAYAGQGEEDVGAVTGALTNMIGGKAARGAQQGIAGAARGVNSPSLNYLNNEQVPLTIGQIGRGSGTTLGNVVGGVEERFAGLPIADAIIGTARRRGDQGFNEAAFRQMGGTGITGAAGVTEGRGLVEGAYNFLDHVTLPADRAFRGAVNNVRTNLPRNLGGGVADRLDNIDNVIADGGVLTGRDWQSAVRGVRADRASLRGQPFSDAAIGSLDEVEAALQDLATRRGPPGTAQNLENANGLYSRFQTVVSALDNGPAQRAGELFSANRLNDASRNAARNFGGRTASMAGERPFYDLTRTGMDVMPNLTPDSGTAGRSLFYASLPAILGGGAGAAYGGMSEGGSAAEGGAAGAGMGAGATIIPALAMAALYSNGGQRGLQRALLGPRPRVLEQAMEAIERNPVTRRALSRRSAGMFGSAAARDLFLYPELEQGF